MQNHLSYKDTVNLGSYYTPNSIISELYEMLNRNIPNLSVFKLVDSSCGYGYFFKNTFFDEKNCIGMDIDREAIAEARVGNPDIVFYHNNSLRCVSRGQYNISEEDKIIMIGNPPYNDTTSIIRNQLKKKVVSIDSDLSARDMGISFLLSYNKLRADYVCVLHPLSYLIKESNFNLLKEFKKNYRLLDSLIFSSAIFHKNKQLVSFPIIIAFYKRVGSGQGMSYDFIKNYTFKTIEGKSFKLNDFDYIKNYVDKYPNGRKVNKKDILALFWTLRDINALNRNRSFVEEKTSNSIFVTKEKMPYYCYIDVFKQNIKHIPYYFGNCDIIIDNEYFLQNKKYFKIAAIENNLVLKKKYFTLVKEKDASEKNYVINNYFKNILGEHYVY